MLGVTRRNLPLILVTLCLMGLMSVGWKTLSDRLADQTAEVAKLKDADRKIVTWADYYLSMVIKEQRHQTAYLDNLESLKQYVVKINRADGGGGSGIVVHSDGKTTTILAAKHVVDAKVLGDIGFTNGDWAFYRIVALSDKYDLAVLEIDDHKVRAVASLAHALPDKVARAAVLGYPVPYFDQGNNPIVSTGLFTGGWDIVHGETLYHVLANINYGNSGGAVFDLDNNALIGVTVRFSYANTGRFVPIHLVIEFLNENNVQYKWSGNK